MKIVLLVVLILLGSILLPFLFPFICSLFVDTRKQYERDSKFYRALLDGSTTVILWCLGVRYQISGEEKFPETGNFLFISNHRSNYDPIIQWTVFKRYKLSFISKKENFKIPLYGRIIHRCCFMPIDRKSPRKPRRKAAHRDRELRRSLPRGKAQQGRQAAAVPRGSS